MARKTTKFPDLFRPLFWSSDFPRLSPERDAKTIIVRLINYGDLPHWRWLVRHYGRRKIKEVLESVPATELRERVRRLSALVFGISQFNHAPRGLRSKR